jgi:putative membrane protein
MQNQSEETQPVHAILNGALAGFIGTVPMTIFMLLTQRFLPKGQHYDLPPELITKDIARKLHVRWHMSKGLVLLATLAAHFGYGATMGAIYAPIEESIPSSVEKRLPLPGLLQGILFGVLVWAGSYFALLPLLGISESGEREPAQRNLMMLAAHVVWGSTLGITAGALMPAHETSE